MVMLFLLIGDASWYFSGCLERTVGRPRNPELRAPLVEAQHPSTGCGLPRFSAELRCDVEHQEYPSKNRTILLLFSLLMELVSRRWLRL